MYACQTGFFLGEGAFLVDNTFNISWDFYPIFLQKYASELGFPKLKELAAPLDTPASTPMVMP